MQVIISHVNTDFDALASMMAAKKLYPEAKVVITDKQGIPVKQFLAIYRDTLDLIPDHQIDWSEVTELIIVDVASLARIGDFTEELNQDNLKITVYDHHPPHEGDVISSDGKVEPVGATVTMLIEEIRKRSLSISPFEATLFGLGIYTDTGSFTFSNTTARDLQAASYLMEQGMNLELIERFSDQILSDQQQEILNYLFQYSSEYKMNGLDIVVSSYKQKKFQGGLATLTRKLLEITDADAVLTIVEMQKRIYIIGRASSERINFLPLLAKWDGGGHEQAGSATLKDAELDTVVKEVINHLEIIIKPAITAKAIMTKPVKTIPPDMTIEEAGHLMYRYGHSGFPIADKGKLLGVISRRDLDKAKHHGLGHAPVKAYMSSNVITIKPDTPLEEIQEVMITHNIGRLPVVDDGKLVGILSRTNIIEILHNEGLKKDLQASTTDSLQNDLSVKMKGYLPKDIFSLLEQIGATGTSSRTSVYLIGGIVRDIILGNQNDDIDIVVEGDGIAFSKNLVKRYGGEVIIHEGFGTATWIHPTGYKIDITSSRLEYYDRPAALPNVESSTLKEDLYRRDFTINAMAICLNQKRFGQLVDPFHGQTDLNEKVIKVLHNLSFVEDPTRILRAVRFETRFQFKMDQQTEEQALNAIDKINDLSVQRINYELEKLFNEEHPSQALKRLFELRFWQQFGISGDFLAESYTHVKQFDMLYKDRVNHRSSWFFYFLIPFFQSNSLDSAKRFALTKKEGKIYSEVTQLKQLIDWQNSNNLGDLHRLLKPYSDAAIIFFLADMAKEPSEVLEANKHSTIQEHIIRYLERRNRLPTYITGDDLIKQGLKPGAIFSEILMDLEVAVLNGDVTNKEHAFNWLEKKNKRWG